jgi:uncharacterized membrane protein
MKKLTLHDLVATLIVAAIVVPFVGYSVRGSMPLVQDPRGMAGVVLVGAVLALVAFGRTAFGSGTFEQVMIALAVITIGLAIAALIAENVWALLVPAVAGVVIVWALALAHDAGYLPARRLASHG